ncbi:hypothetical protein B0920_05925 [Massilia sp. KIM]|uniref:hypothetical protein n=1 Tax=Massilia sp. KIM TaxID=1955422 RepID=UPI00098FEB7C|nr:hypothetical protein [Massilia sp. KIM]OON62959.1 hypothetical protein B0920_05925 [Massilia sp. KIM]
MPKNKRPVPRKSNNVREPDTAAQAKELADLALEIAEREDAPGFDADDEREEALTAAVRKAVRKKRDAVLYEAIELARYTDPLACRLLRGRIEEEAATWRFKREDGPEYEIDAFLVPLFVRSTGGLVAQESFRDEEAFAALATSFQAAGLDSKGAKVVLIQHAYDLAEVDHIAYSTLHEMLREAAASLLEKKLQPAPTIEASIRGWTGEPVAPDETAMELRFLLGFSLKRADDPFYRVPKDEAGSDAYFARRLERYRDWTVDVAPLVRRCLALDPERLSVDFLYQDLFYGAKEQGVAELSLLGLLSEVRRTLAAKELEPDQVHAAVAPLDMGEHIVLRANLYALDGGLPWGSVEKAVDLAADLGAEVDDLCDALLSIGLEGVSVATGFSQDGHAEGAEPYQPA